MLVAVITPPPSHWTRSDWIHKSARTHMQQHVEDILNNELGMIL